MYGLMVVVGAVVYRSAQIVGGPDYSWAPVAAFNPSWSFFTALPLIIFAFQASAPVGTAAAACLDAGCRPPAMPADACGGAANQPANPLLAAVPHQRHQRV